MRTQYDGTYGYQTFDKILRKEGLKGFYRGFLPASLIYTASNYAHLRDLI